MEYKKFGDIIAVKIDRGEEVLGSLKEVCEKENVKSGSITGLGAAGHAVIGLYKVAERKYYSNTFDGEMEMTSIIGNVSEKDGEVYLHCHANFAKADGSVIGGHLSEAVISGACEIFIHTIKGRIGRKKDNATGLNVFDFSLA